MAESPFNVGLSQDSARDVRKSIGTPLLREIDKGLAKSPRLPTRQVRHSCQLGPVASSHLSSVLPGDTDGQYVGGRPQWARRRYRPPVLLGRLPVIPSEPSAEESGLVDARSCVSDEYLWREVVMYGGYDVVAKPLVDSVVSQTLQRAWYYWKADPLP